MSNYSIAYRYDKTLLHLALDLGILEEVHNDMLLVEKAITENRDLALMLKNPVISHQKKLRVLREIFKGKVNKLTMSLFEIISKKNREDILPDIAKGFHQQYNEHKGIIEAEVATIYPIDDLERKAFIDVVRAKTGAKTVKLNEKIDPDLIGGFVLTTGDKEIDSSLLKKLKSLKIKFES